MGFKDILVVLDTGAAARGRVELAASLAERFGAHLIGLHTMVAAEAPQRHGYFEVFDRSLLDPLYRDFAEKMQAEAEATHALFDKIMNRRGVSAEWRCAAHEASRSPSEIAAMHGRYADLIVLGQLEPDDISAPLFRPLPEEVALAVGRPILVVPYAGSFAETGRRVLIGWDASREATRAINDAMPLLQAAQAVTVLAVDPGHGPRNPARGHGEVPGADIALHLARHGVKATIERTASAGIGAGNALLSRASDLEADLLVMGAYGHSRVRELLLGGATRTVLESMTLPVLMAH